MLQRPYALLCVPYDDCISSKKADCGDLMLVCNDLNQPHTFFSKSSAVQYACDMLAPDFFFFVVLFSAVNPFQFPSFQI